MRAILFGTICLSLSAAAIACGPPRALVSSYRDLLAAGKTDDATHFVNGLRQGGQSELDLLFQVRDLITKDLTEAGENETLREQLMAEYHAASALIEAVGGARYCTVSRLFWHTDLDRAKQVSRETGKPILSLRMLGRLTDELSCANSRFFRTTLYSNAAISQLLRDKFVLHWESVRPVPVITIDFGDGRKLVRTITGNSAHYVLDAEGRPVDCLPGLYSPRAFTEWLEEIEPVARGIMADESSRASSLVAYHRTRLDLLDLRWRSDLARLADGSTEQPQVAAVAPRNATNDAERAAVIAAPKRAVEFKAIRNVAVLANAAPVGETDDPTWQRLADLYRESVSLDVVSRNVIAGENPTAQDAMRLAFTKSKTENPILKAMFNRLEADIALDTVRNEYQLHRRIHEWFAAEDGTADVTPLNERVYAELFLTPRSDPWLGLVDQDVYTAITDAGVVGEPGTRGEPGT
jgi:hypothetical protein